MAETILGNLEPVLDMARRLRLHSVGGDTQEGLSLSGGVDYGKWGLSGAYNTKQGWTQMQASKSGDKGTFAYDKDPEMYFGNPTTGGEKLVYRTTKGSIGLSKPQEGPVIFYLGRGFQSPKYNANVGFNVSPNEVGLSFGGQFY